MEKINYKKKYGQNFLSDTNLLRAIVSDSLITKNDEVLEIGAGAGALTKQIASVAKKVISFEIDSELESVLTENLAGFENINLIFNDIMREKTSKIDDFFEKNYKIIANLPYYITTPILFKFLEESKKVESLTVMVQKEVAEKLVALPKNSNYGVLTVMANYYADIKITRIVKKQMFTPMPKVDSAIVFMKRKNVPFNPNFKNLVQTAFSMRRKTLVNNLQKLYPKDQILQALEMLNLGANVRAEELSYSQFVQMLNFFDKI